MSKKTTIVKSPKFVIVGSSPDINTGFSYVGRSICNLVKRTNMFSDIEYIGYNTPSVENTDIKNEYRLSIPKDIKVSLELSSVHKYGYSRVKEIVKESGDRRVYIFTIGDVWNFYYMEQFTGRNNVIWIPYIPVESTLPMTTMGANNAKDIAISVPSLCNKADMCVAYSKEGMRAINNIGIECNDYLYHMIDRNIIDNTGRSILSNKITKLIKDVSGNSTIIGTVSANTFRKGLDSILSVIHRLTYYYNDDVFLIIHSPTGRGSSKAMQLMHLIREYGIPATLATVLVQPSRIDRGDATVIGYNDETIDGIYRSFDLYLNMSRAEGFGLPIIESASRGIPTITPDSFTLGEIADISGINTIPSASNLTSHSGTTQLVKEPNVEKAAEMIHDMISNNRLTNRQYNLDAFDINNQDNINRMGIILEKACNIEKNYNRVAIAISKNFISNYKNVHVINAAKSGVKTYGNISELLDIYSKYDIDFMFDDLGSKHNLTNSYRMLVKQYSDLLFDTKKKSINNVYAYTNNFPLTEIDIDVKHKVPNYINLDTVKNNWFSNIAKNNHVTHRDNKKSVLIMLISTLGVDKNCLIDTLDVLNSRDDIRIDCTFIDSAITINCTANIPLLHIKSSGIPFREFDNIKTSEYDYVILPHDIKLNIEGLYIRREAIRIAESGVLLNTSNFGLASTKDIINIGLNNNVHSIYGSWKSICEIIDS